jgi:hypothetical protein
MTEMCFEIKCKTENYCWSSAKAHLNGSIGSLSPFPCSRANLGCPKKRGNLPKFAAKEKGNSAKSIVN